MKTGLKCPNCKKSVGLGEQVQEWDDYHGEDVDIELCAKDIPVINIVCANCDESVALVFIEPPGEAEEVYNPIFKENIKFPKRRTN